MIARFAAILCICLAPLAWAQGFADLGTDADGFALPAPDTELSFPADHFSHPEFRIEWWYLTANLRDADGTEYGIQWTLFRSALAPEAGKGWQTPQIWMGHAALTTAQEHRFAQKLARGGIGQAGIEPAPFAAFIDDWRLQSTAEAGDPLDALTVSARGADFAYELSLAADGPLVLQGEEGYSVKALTGEASYYYSQPFYEVTGTLSLPGGDVEVSGQGWLDREWSSQPLSEDQLGWDWLSLHFADGSKLFAAGLRQRDGGRFTAGTLVSPDGEKTRIDNGEVTLTPLGWAEVAGREVPVRWRVELPEAGIAVETEPLNPQAWMGTLVPYWEGPIRFSGSHDGVGYLEMTGYE